MAAFFAQSGKLTNSYIKSTGEWPTRVHVAVFEYSDGSRAEYDGKTWVFRAPDHV